MYALKNCKHNAFDKVTSFSCYPLPQLLRICNVTMYIVWEHHYPNESIDSQENKDHFDMDIKR